MPERTEVDIRAIVELRAFDQALKENNDLLIILYEKDPNLEVGAILFTRFSVINNRASCIWADSAGEPPVVLRGFEKVVDIEPGKTKTAEISLSYKSFSIWDVTSQSWLIPYGTYIISAAAHSRDLRLNKTLAI